MATADCPMPGALPSIGAALCAVHSSATQVQARGPSVRKIQVDWNRLRPTGDEQSIKKLLTALAATLDGVVFLATTGTFGQLSTVCCSDETWNSAKRLPPEVSSALLEATVCQSVIAASLESQGLSRVLPQAIKELGATAAFAVSVRLNQSPARCGLLLVQKPAPSADGAHRMTELMEAAALETAPWLDAFLMCRSGQRIANWKRSIARFQGRRASLAAAVVLLIIASLAIPVPYWPKRECVIEPATRQFVASPIVGRMEQAWAKPGDEVGQGQLLARLHGDELKRELSSAEAELEAAAKKKDSALAAGAAGNMRIAQLEQQQIALRIESIREKLNRLEVRSPIDGVVVQGDWSRREGAPVEHGATLFEIAPLGRMTVETHLRTEDLAEIEVGDDATLRVDSAFGRTWKGKLTRIDPRARTLDDTVVFVAEMNVENDSQLLRPGTRGSVRISPGAKSLGWLLFSRPYHWLMKKVVW